jgi:hypothetical protein
MPRARHARVPKAPNEQQDYRSWKTNAAEELRERHQIEAATIAERIWTQFYVHRLEPKEAADRAAMVHRRTRPVTHG